MPKGVTHADKNMDSMPAPKRYVSLKPIKMHSLLHQHEHCLLTLIETTL